MIRGIRTVDGRLYEVGQRVYLEVGRTSAVVGRLGVIDDDSGSDLVVEFQNGQQLVRRKAPGDEVWSEMDEELSLDEGDAQGHGPGSYFQVEQGCTCEWCQPPCAIKES